MEIDPVSETLCSLGVFFFFLDYPAMEEVEKVGDHETGRFFTKIGISGLDS
jgi:hypothetical protein